MGRCTRGNGRTIYSMAGASRPGRIRASMRESTPLAGNMALAVISGMMAASTRAIGERIRLAVLEFILGSTEEGMRASG